MSIRIVEEFRLIYRQKFMQQVMHIRYPGVQATTEAFLTEAFLTEKELQDLPEGTNAGFPGSLILIEFTTEENADICAINTVVTEQVDAPTGIIQISKALLGSTPKEQKYLKMVAAHEWIEVMLKLRDGRLNKRTIAGREAMTMLFTALRNVQGQGAGEDLIKEVVMLSPWQDSGEDEAELLAALRHLLVSTQSLDEMVRDDFGVAGEGGGLREMAKTNPERATEILVQLAAKFSLHWSVDLELVYDRIREWLF